MNRVNKKCILTVSSKVLNSLKSLLLVSFVFKDTTFTVISIIFADNSSTCAWRRASCTSRRIVSTSNHTAKAPTAIPSTMVPPRRRLLFSIPVYCRSNSPLIKFLDKSFTSFKDSDWVYMVIGSGISARFSAITPLLHTALAICHKIANKEQLAVIGPLLSSRKVDPIDNSTCWETTERLEYTRGRRDVLGASGTKRSGSRHAALAHACTRRRTFRMQ